MAAKLVKEAGDALVHNRQEAIQLVQAVGLRKTRELLEDATRDLQKRIDAKVRAGADEGFSLAQMRTTLAQIKLVTRDLTYGLKDTILDTGAQAADHAAGHTLEYLGRAEKAFTGVAAQPLALKEASMLSSAKMGVQASILRRLASSGEPVEGADDEPHPAKLGILQRYGVETVGHFEKTLRRGLLARKSWREMRQDLIAQSPFLQQAPASWATRIVRTEVMGAYGRAGWEAIREADDQLGDMTKILSATFDERTGSDSFAVHGQIRLPEEAFESWYGFYQHPPNRPNDREVVVPHRISWPIPPYLAWKDASQIAARWRLEGRKGRPPERPEMTTVALDRFGNSDPPRMGEGGGESEESDED